MTDDTVVHAASDGRRKHRWPRVAVFAAIVVVGAVGGVVGPRLTTGADPLPKSEIEQRMDAIDHCVAPACDLPTAADTGLTVNVDGEQVSTDVVDHGLANAWRLAARDNLIADRSDAPVVDALVPRVAARVIFDRFLWLEANQAGIAATTAEAEAYASQQLASYGSVGGDAIADFGRPAEEYFSDATTIEAYRRLLTLHRQLAVIDGSVPLELEVRVAKERAWMASMMAEHAVVVTGLPAGVLPAQLPDFLNAA